MDLVTLQDRLAKLEVKIEKKKKSITRIEDELAGKREMRYSEEMTRDDLKYANNSLIKMQNTLAKYEKQIAEKVADDNVQNNLPKVFDILVEELVKVWDSWDLSRLERLKEEWSEVKTYRDFIQGVEASNYQTHTRAEYMFLKETPESIHEKNEKASQELVLDLFKRVIDITGEVTDWSYLSVEQGNDRPVITGTVAGEKGKARVETILAGGYNIQRLHIRTLIHEVN